MVRFSLGTTTMMMALSADFVLQSKAVDEELNFHKSVFQLQLDYVRSLINAMRYTHEKKWILFMDSFIYFLFIFLLGKDTRNLRHQCKTASANHWLVSWGG